MTAFAGTIGHAEPGGQDTVGRLIRIAFLVRLLALAFAVVALTVSGGNLPTALLFCGLALTSQLGLQSHSVRQLVARHPAVALPDILLVSSVPLLTGADSPLSVVAVSSALLIGVLFELRTSFPLAILLASTYLVADLLMSTGGQLMTALPVPVMLLSITAIGTAVRRMAEQQRQAEARSALALSAATAAQERLRLARDLHDTVAKSVQGVALTASALSGWIDRDAEVAHKHARQVAHGAREAVSAARDLLSSLRLDDPERPLADVLEEAVYRWRADRGLVVEHDLDEVPDLPAGHRHELVCAIAEAMQNVSLHAPGASARLTLRCVQGDAAGTWGVHEAVVATVTDDGPGFPPHREEEAVRDGHYGLTGMRERLASVGGRAEVRTAPGFGTEVLFSVPVSGAAVAAGATRHVAHRRKGEFLIPLRLRSRQSA